MADSKKCVTVTFGDVSENGVGMKKQGTMAEQGFSVEQIHDVAAVCTEMGIECEVYHLHDLLPDDVDTDGLEAAVVVMRGAATRILEESGESVDSLRDFLFGLPWDTKEKMRGTVKNLRARYKVCFGDEAIAPDIAEGQGTVIPFSDSPELVILREFVGDLLAPDATNLEAEGNCYYDITKCGIGYHGDAERLKVVAVRVGAPMNICWHWYIWSKRIGTKFSLTLNHGDMYIMSQKTTGYDWRKKKIHTLRHAAGCDKYTN